MNTNKNNQPTGDKPEQTTAGSEKASQISQPHTERAEGPFEHSGETSGWTEEERLEKEDEEKE